MNELTKKELKREYDDKYRRAHHDNGVLNLEDRAIYLHQVPRRSLHTVELLRERQRCSTAGCFLAGKKAGENPRRIAEIFPGESGGDLGSVEMTKLKKLKSELMLRFWIYRQELKRSILRVFIG